MLEINVAQFLKSPIGTTRKYEVDEPVKISDGMSVVRGEVDLLRTNRGILVTGRLVTDIEITCARCLSQFRQPLTLDIEEEYFPTIDILTGSPVAVPEDEPGAFTIDDNNILDLGEAVRQYSLLAVPMKPLCREDCPGLCPTCGANLNVVSCDCPRADTDPLWQKLADKAELTTQKLEADSS
ncbi:MAG: hypothetical protein A2147_10555 [Chloroflexi bacterium RBG_16_57_8]|nr:MAG: hypothetical protein A2147_10555 [Chloroflexi bacterium RBG_16_57_8]